MAEPALERSSNPGGSWKTIVLGTAGHIDHGKTALIRALTGVDTDRLPEEKKRGITIDIGFASMDLPSSDVPSLCVSFIDVPGHARFVRNMLAGAGGIDAVLLVISAEEGVKPQTEEHLAICSLLGIQRGITVLTKTDAVDEARLSEVRSAVERRLSTTFLAAEPIVGVSAFTGVGIDRLRNELGLLAMRTTPRGSEIVTRLPIDRAFTMKGFGTVVTGTLLSGRVSSGQDLALEPGDRRVRVRGIQMHGQSASKAEAATRAALNFSGIEAGELERGDTLVEPSTITAVDLVDAEIALLPGATALKHHVRVHFHAFASECMATVSLYGYQPVEPGSERLARLRLSRPIVLLPGDRFVLRQGSPITTAGGGIVLDAHPAQRLKKAQTQNWLEQLQHATPEEQLTLRIARRGASGVSMAELSSETGLKADSIRARLGPKMDTGDVRLLGGSLLVSSSALGEAAALVEEELGRLFKDSGNAGVKRSVLKSRLHLRSEVADSVLRNLEQQAKLRVAGEELLLPDAAQVPSLEKERAESIERAYRAAGLASPSPGNLAAVLAIDPGQVRRLITILLREKKLVRLGDDSLCVHQEALTELKRRLQMLCGQTIDVAQFKDLSGVSRKYAIPLLEYLDRERVTRKQGDRRIVL